MVQTQWQQTLRRKIGLSGRFSESHITNQRRRSGRGGFSTDSTWLSAEAPWFKLSVYSGGCWRTPTPLLAYSYSNDLGLYAEEIDGRTGDAQAVFRAIFVLCISSVDELSG